MSEPAAPPFAAIEELAAGEPVAVGTAGPAGIPGRATSERIQKAVAYTAMLAISLLFFIPFLGRFLWLVVSAVLSVFWFIVWVVLVVKALQGEKFKLPWIGDWAERAAER